MEIYLSFALTAISIFLIFAVIFEDELVRKIHFLLLAVILLTLSDIVWRAARYAYG